MAWLSVIYFFLTLMNTPPYKFRSKVLMLLTSEFVTARFHALREKAPYLDIVTELAPGPNEEIDVVFARLRQKSTAFTGFLNSGLL